MTTTSAVDPLQDSSAPMLAVVSIGLEISSFPSSSFCLFVSGLEDLEFF